MYVCCDVRISRPHYFYVMKPHTYVIVVNSRILVTLSYVIISTVAEKKSHPNWKYIESFCFETDVFDKLRPVIRRLASRSETSPLTWQSRYLGRHSTHFRKKSAARLGVQIVITTAPICVTSPLLGMKILQRSASNSCFYGFLTRGFVTFVSFSCAPTLWTSGEGGIEKTLPNFSRLFDGSC